MAGSVGPSNQHQLEKVSVDFPTSPDPTDRNTGMVDKGEDVCSGDGTDGHGGPSNQQQVEVFVDKDLAPSPAPMDKNSPMVEVSIVL